MYCVYWQYKDLSFYSLFQYTASGASVKSVIDFVSDNNSTTANV